MLAGKRRKERSESGAAAVEFTLVFVFILVPLIFGMITYGFALHYRQAVSQAATEGARAAAVTPAGWSVSQKEDRARGAVSAALNAYGISCEGKDLVQNGQSIGACGVKADVKCEANGDAGMCARVTVAFNDDNTLVPSFPGLGFLVPDLGYTAQAEVSE